MKNKLSKDSLLVYILAFGVFSILNTEMGVVGILPYISQVYGVEISAAGLLVSLFALSVAVSGAILPLVFSKYNRRTVMILVLGSFFVCNLISAVSTDFTVVLIARAFMGLLHPVYVSLAFAVASSSAAPENAVKAVAKVLVGVSAGMVIGVPIANYIANLFSLEAAMLFFAAVNLIALITTIVFVPSMPVKTKMTYGAQLKVLKQMDVWLAIIGVIFLNGAIYGVFSYLAKFLASVSMLTAEFISIALLIYGLANILGNLWAGKILSVKPWILITTVPMALLCLYITMLLFGTSGIIMAGVVCVWGVVTGAAGNLNQYWITRAAPHVPDFGNALFLVATNIGTCTATFICGIAIDFWGINDMVFGGIGFLVLAMLFMLWKLKREKRQAYSLSL